MKMEGDGKMQTGVCTAFETSTLGHGNPIPLMIRNRNLHASLFLLARKLLFFSLSHYNPMNSHFAPPAPQPSRVSGTSPAPAHDPLARRISGIATHWSFLLLFGFQQLFSTQSEASVRLISPAGYLPSAPVLVRVDVLNTSNSIDRDLWNAEATLETTGVGVTLSTNRITLRNGSGSALLSITGGGDFVLTARVNGETGSKQIRNRATEPMIDVGGTLVGNSPTWSGILNITNTVTIPASSTLTIAPDTLILINGQTSGTQGIGIQVNGAIQSLGTEQNPISISSTDPTRNWGQIRHENAQPSLYQFTLISKAGRGPGEGHTGTGPALRTSNSSIVFTDSMISDLTAGGGTIGKIMMATGSNLEFRNCILARARMGPEIAGTGLEMRNSFIVEMTGPDDADGIYLHDSGGRPLLLADCVIARGDDDAVDTFDSSVTLRNCILRDWANPNEDAKGVSVFHGEVTIEYCLIDNCFVGVSAKSSGPLATVRIDHCTITGIESGVTAATKSNASAGNINFFLSNSIVRSVEPIRSDFGPERFVSVSYCDLSAPWPGTGNITEDPLFVDANAGNYRLQPGSPAIDAGDPAFALDADGSRSDIGYASGTSSSGGFFVSIVSPSSGAIFVAPTNITFTAIANSSTGTVSRVEFFEGANKLGESLTSPFQAVWNDVPIGIYTIRAMATQTGGLTTSSSPLTLTVGSSDGPSTNLLVKAGSDWKYLDDGSDAGDAWISTGFDDASWRSGPAQLGYGDGDEATVIGFGPNTNTKYPTTYFRHTFVVEDPVQVKSLTLELLRDDGAIVHLNGREAFRVTMPPGPVTYQTFAATASEYNWEQASLDPLLLVSGKNVIAVEIHQGNARSSDISFDLALSAVVSAPTNSKPLVVLTSPTAGSIYGVPASLLISAKAVDTDGSITNVAFFANGTKLGDSAVPPYGFAWSGMPAGDYQLTAVAADATGLSGTSEPVTITVSTDVAPPTLSSRFPTPGDVTNLSEIVVTFSKNVTGVDAADLLINGIPATDVSGSDREYTFTLGPVPPGSGSISWAPSHGIMDLFTPPRSFDANSAGAVWQYQIFDTIPPRVEGLVPAARSTVPNLMNLAITFSEPVSGLKPEDLLLNSAPATGLSGSGAGPYTFVFPQPKPGTVTVTWAPTHLIRDFANNLLNRDSWSYVLDTTSIAVTLNEILYHPVSENPLEEFIELLNRGSAPVNLKGWRFSDGVEFTFPDITLPGGAFLVVAADLATFQTKYPDVTNVVGGWTGQLSNNSEDIDLDDAAGRRVDSVRFASSGDWAIRQRGPLDRGHRGWEWLAEHDGLGQSLEVINPNVTNNSGQNWAASRIPEGTPGRANSVLLVETAPLVENVRHSPVVPHSNESVLVTTRVSDASGMGIIVTLNYRADSASPPPFTPVLMVDDGSNGDASAGDGIFSAILPAQANITVVEFYITATDGLGNSRFWPAPAIASADDAAQAGQEVNALYQVDDTVYAGAQPLYKIIMTETERAELAAIPSQSSNQGPNAQMNATFVSIDGTGTELRYLVGVRNRGHGSRTANPPNYRVNFRNDDPWKGVEGINLNTRQVHTQNFGSRLAIQSGAAGYYSQPVQVRVNNANLANQGSGMFGSYAANEVYAPEWVKNHIPFDADGNIYKVVRDIRPPNFDYRGEDKTAYTNTYFKVTNTSEDDWTDVIAMLRVMGENSGDLFTVENIEQVVNLDQWLTHLAVMNIMANGESGLNTGNNDDYYMYRGLVDPRFILLFHDFDQILGQPGSLAQNVDIFRSTCCPISGDSEGSWRAMARLLHSPEIEPLYYAKLQHLLDTTFSKPAFDRLLDQTFGGYVPETTRDAISRWMDGRRVFVQSQLPAISPIPAPVILVSGIPRSPTPQTSVSLTLSGDEITHYRYQLNGGEFGAETSVSNPIAITGLPNGTNTLAVIGMNSAGVWQTESNATVRQWVIKPSWPTVRLNEILANNRSALNRGGTFPDAIELFNEGPAPVNLSGMRLTDDPALTDKYIIPPGVTLAASAFLVIDSTQLGFGLDEGGEGVFLFHTVANGGALLDSVEFGTQLPDLSIGRLNQGGEWLPTQPTFGSPNLAQTVGDLGQIRINEWLASGTNPFPVDFVELYNPDARPVDLSGAFLTDQPLGAPTRNGIRPLSFIAPGGFALFQPGGRGNAAGLNFQLEADQGELALFSPSMERIDSIAYGPQVTGISQGRCPDGGPLLESLKSPSPGGANLCPDKVVPPELVSLIPFDSIWKYNLSGADLGNTWIAEGYDDSTWSTGPGPLGFENAALPEPLRTPFPNPGNVITYYFRTTFNADAALVHSSLRLTHMIDDGAAFYINGKDLGIPFNLRAGTAANGLASGTVGNAALQTIDVAPGKIRAGLNEMAVEVHQSTLTSSDMVFGLQLEGTAPEKPLSSAPLLINELFANSDTGSALFVDSDWLELYNPTDTPATLAGMSLTDDPAVPRRWTFPENGTVPAQGFLIVQFDPNTAASSTNAGFGLKSNSGAVYLISPPEAGGGVLDSLTYGLQPGDWSLARLSADAEPWSLGIPTPGRTNLPAPLGNRDQLRINEWMAAPTSGPDWFELFNSGTQPIAIGGVWLSDTLTNPEKHQISPRSFIGTGASAFIRFDADGSPEASATHASFSLSAGGESLVISEPNGVLIDGISFGPQATGVTQGRFPDGTLNITTFEASPTPGSSNFLPLKNVFINELLTHSDPPLEDAVEFYNADDTAVDIGGWFLSDSAGDPGKFVIPANTIIPARGHAVLYEFEFNATDAPKPFSFNSAKSGSVFLSEAIAGVPSGFRAFASFGPAENGVSFGRIQTSQGAHFVPMTRLTFGSNTPASLQAFRSGTGAENAAPRVGPIVIHEILYKPQDPETALEFVELRNVGSTEVSLFDPGHPENTWRLGGGIDFKFATGSRIPPGGQVVIVPFDPETDTVALGLFLSAYGSQALLAGPFSGRLNNAGDTVELLKPDPPQTRPGPDFGKVPYIAVDRVDYSNIAPWPVIAAVSGFSIQKQAPSQYGNDPVNWSAATPSPDSGSGPVPTTDTDGDGLPDTWETANGFNPNDASDANGDADGDGLSNAGEYIAGTDPRVPTSRLQAEVQRSPGGVASLSFISAPNRIYTIEFRKSLVTGAWETVAEIPSGNVPGKLEFPITNQGLTGFLRISVRPPAN